MNLRKDPLPLGDGGSMPTPQQLVLPLTLTPQTSRADFLIGESNRQALQTLDQWPQWAAPVVLLIGDDGAGKTHLAHIFAEQTGAQIVLGANLSAFDPVALARSVVVVEDIDRASVSFSALFHLINAVRAAGSSLLLTSRQPPERFAASLPDLLSRLRAAMCIRLGAPETELLERLLVKLFADRQMIVEPSILAYLLPRMERTCAAALRLVAAMDEAALVKKRPITRSIAAEALEKISKNDLSG